MPNFKFISVALVVLGLANAAHSYSGEQYITCQLDPKGDNFVALRSCPANSCDTIMKLGPDTFLLTSEPEFENGWREVMVISGLQDESYSGPIGWVNGDYICEIRYPNKR
jgi:hypothetical protein